MSKLKKSPQYHFGIEVTKPHSKEMYDHNDRVAEQMKTELYKVIKSHREPENLTKIRPMAELELLTESFTGYSFANPSVSELAETAESYISKAANYLLHEAYSYLCMKDIVPKLKQGMIGHNVPFFVYYTDEILNGRTHINVIETIAKDRLKWSSCSDQDGNSWREPYVKCSNKQEAESVSFSLKCNGIDAYVDCYEDDDGSDGGRPIIRKIYSVKIKNY